MKVAEWCPFDKISAHFVVLRCDSIFYYCVCFVVKMFLYRTYIGKLHFELQGVLELDFSPRAVGAQQHGDVHHVLIVRLHQLVAKSPVQVLSAESQRGLVQLPIKFSFDTLINKLLNCFTTRIRILIIIRHANKLASAPNFGIRCSIKIAKENCYAKVL